MTLISIPRNFVMNECHGHGPEIIFKCNCNFMLSLALCLLQVYRCF